MSNQVLLNVGLNRLRWRCQRGMLELDHILGRFLDSVYPTASPEIQQAFEAILELEDADLMDLIMARSTPPQRWAELLVLLRRPASGQ